MSSKDYCDVLAIHLVPASTSKEEFEAKFGTFLDAVAKLPVLQKNAITLKMFIQNDAFHESVAGFGLPVPKPAVVGFARFKVVPVHLAYSPMAHPRARQSADGLKELLRDPEYVSLVSAAKENGHLRGHDDMSLFSADVTTKIDVNHTGDRKHVFGIFKVPNDVPAELFERKVEACIDGALALEACQNNFLKYKMASRLSHEPIRWRQTSNITDELPRLGFPAPQPWIVAMAEFANLDNLLEVGKDQDLAQHLAATLTTNEFPLHIDIIVFAAEGVTKFNSR
ncbi:hypothetical protein GGX14DRAFT_457234 [Mycena pura]|uniref:Uncharacterized protein n=1 Tax=Mycena pura TaxID=153505 RepID=A0AAD6VA98_9AGAR|nr:hypothetical protein GGX14DRAFT_457234 [Mycena pura]